MHRFLGESQPTGFIGVQASAFVASIQDSLDDKWSFQVEVERKGFTIPGDLIVQTGPTKVWMPGTKCTKIETGSSHLEVPHADGFEETEEGTKDDGGREDSLGFVEPGGLAAAWRLVARPRRSEESLMKRIPDRLPGSRDLWPWVQELSYQLHQRYVAHVSPMYRSI